MYEAKCYDLYGNSVDYFTQWDTNQKIVIKLEGCGDDYHVENDELQTDPEVHFTNIKRETALAVKATAVGNEITVDVPNLILEEPYPVLIYVYYTSSLYPSSQSTIARTEIAVRQKAQPHDYYYVENITTVTAVAIKQEILDDVTSDIDAEFSAIKTNLNDTTNQMRTDITNEVSADIIAANDRMDEIEESFEAATTSVNNMKEDVQALKDQAKSEEEVFSVEGQTMHVENVSVNQNLTVGNWIWFNNDDKSLSLKWVGGDA